VVEVMDDGDDEDDVNPDKDGFTGVFCQFFRSYFSLFRIPSAKCILSTGKVCCLGRKQLSTLKN
jgi:hypothetical protein